MYVLGFGDMVSILHVLHPEQRFRNLNISNFKNEMGYYAGYFYPHFEYECKYENERERESTNTRTKNNNMKLENATWSRI